MIIHTKVITPEPSPVLLKKDPSTTIEDIHGCIMLYLHACLIVLLNFMHCVLNVSCQLALTLALVTPTKINKNPAQMVNPFGFEYTFFTVQY